MIKSISLVFAGGMAKGAYQIGFCKAFCDLKLMSKLKYVSAASIGTLNAYSLITNKVDLAEKMWLDANTKNFRNFFDEIVKRAKMYNCIDELCEESDTLKIPLYSVNWTPPKTYVNYVNISDENDFQTRLDYLKASISFAPLMKPVKIHGTSVFDGAIIENVPVNPPVDRCVDLIIVIQFDAFAPPINRIYAKNSLFLNLDNSKEKLLSSFTADSQSVKEMIDYGYEYSYDILKLVFKCESDKELSKVVALINQSIKEKPVSGDKVIRRINKIVKKINGA